MWWRRFCFSLKGKVGIHDQARAAPLRHPASQHQPAHPCTTATLAAALPREPGRIDMPYQWIVRVLANPLIACDAVMLPFAREVLAQAQAEARPGERVELILDQSRASERHQILMLALRWGERALPLAWRVEETLGSIGFAVQQQLLDTVAAWLPEAARVRLLGDRFYGTPALIAHCQALDWDYRLRLKGNVRA